MRSLYNETATMTWTVGDGKEEVRIFLYVSTVIAFYRFPYFFFAFVLITLTFNELLKQNFVAAVKTQLVTAA
jgi:hypothetical protein